MSLSPPAMPSTPPSSLAALLAESYQELESLRHEISSLRKRVEKAERLSSSLQALVSESNPNQNATNTSDPASTSTSTTNPPFPESATRILMDFEDRAVRAELARDEAEARKRVLMDTWSQLDSYLIAVSEAAADARSGYGRIVSEGGGQLVLAQIPTLPGSTSGKHQSRVSGRTPVISTMTLPSNPYSYPHSHPSPRPHTQLQPNQNQNQHAVVIGNRRPRTPSMDGYQQQPPTKRPRGEDRDRSGYVGESVRVPCSEMFILFIMSLSQIHASGTLIPHQQPYQGELYHHPDPYAPQHTYPPPPPPPRTSHHGHLAPHPPMSHLSPPPTQAQARMILPPHQNHHHSRAHSRSSRRHRTSRSRSSSSSASLSVDEMLLQATTGNENGLGVGHAPPGPPGVTSNGAGTMEHTSVSRQRSSRRGDRNKERGRTHALGYEPTVGHVPENAYPQVHADVHGHPAYPPTSYRKIGGGSGASEANGHGNSNGTGGETREFQTHIFAPPVTGAPTKKSKFSGQGGCSIFGELVGLVRRHLALSYFWSVDV
jgi:hypothetical protein